MRPEQQRLHRMLRTPHLPRDRRVPQSSIHLQPQCSSLPARQLPHRLTDSVRELAAFLTHLEHFIRPRTVILHNCGQPRLQVPFQRFAPKPFVAMIAQPVEGQVRRNRPQPRREASRRLIPSACSIHSQKGFLRDVLGSCLVPHNALSEQPRVSPVADHQLIQTMVLSTLQTKHQFRIVSVVRRTHPHASTTQDGPPAVAIRAVRSRPLNTA